MWICFDEAMEQLHYRAVEELFLPCPFCGEKVDVLCVPDKRYGRDATTWDWSAAIWAVFSSRHHPINRSSI
jgi:hypothetical protein